MTAERHLYTRLVSMFARQKGGLDMAMRIFDRMQANGIRPDTVAFNSAITVAGEPRPCSLAPGLDQSPTPIMCQRGDLLQCRAPSWAEDLVGLPSHSRPLCREGWQLAEGNEAVVEYAGRQR